MKVNHLKNIFNQKKNFFFFLFCLYPWFLISGPFLSDLIAIILSFFSILSKHNAEILFKLTQKIHKILKCKKCIKTEKTMFVYNKE